MVLKHGGMAVVQRTCGTRFDTLANVASPFETQERGLCVSQANLRVMVYVLPARFGKFTELAPPMTEYLNDESREKLVRYRELRSLPGLGYLNGDLVKALSGEVFEPKRVSYKRSPRFRTHSDRFTFVRESGGGKRCILGTTATGIRGGLVCRLPEIRITAATSDLKLEALRPNIFDLKADSTRTEVAEWPTGLTLNGTTALYGQDTVVSDSTIGFMAGFRKLAKACNRPKFNRLLQ